MKSKVLTSGFFPALFFSLFCTLFLQGQTVTDPTLSATKADWYQRMQDPNANFFQTQAAFEAYWRDKPEKKGDGYKVFRRWEYIQQGRTDERGNLPAPGHIMKEYNKFIQTYPESITAGWQQIGPVSLPGNATNPLQPNGMGRINQFGFHPTDPNTVYAAAPSGGLWRTDNLGQTWEVLTDYLPTLGTSCVIVDYINPSILYIGTGDRDANDAPGLGVYKSTDGGSYFYASNNGMGNVTVNMMLIHPSDHHTLLAATSEGIFRTTDAGQNWTLVTTINNHSYKDIRYKPGSEDTLYATSVSHHWTITPNARFHRSVDGGNTWTSDETVIPGNTTRLVIGITPANPELVFLGRATPTWGGLLKSTDAGATFTQLTATPNILGYECLGNDTKQQSGYDFAIAVSPSNENIVHIGGICIWRSTNGGSSWTINAHWFGGCITGTVIHADIHAMEYHPLSNRFFVAHDGGVHHSSDGISYTDFSSGLAIAQIYKIGQSKQTNNLTMNGYQDNGTALFSGTSFSSVIGGDGMECAIDPSDDNYKYGELYYGDIRRSVSNGIYRQIAKTSNGLTEAGEGDWVTPYLIDLDNSSTMIAGFYNVWRTTNLKASSHTTVTWSAISSGEIEKCVAMDQSSVNTGILYVARRRRTDSNGNILVPPALQRTDNMHATTPSWVTCTVPFGQQITSLEAHNTDENIVYATTSQGVYKSYDKGLTWNNITGNLPAIPKNCIFMEAGPTETYEGLYVGTTAGIYYRNQFTGDWTPYSQGLPVADVRELEMYYDLTLNGQHWLKAATYGRGLWQSPPFTFPDMPTFVNATDGAYPSVVHVKWAPASQRPYYRVYRSLINHSAYATPVTGWIMDLEYYDYNPAIGVPQYYFVMAADNMLGENPSDMSQGDEGSTIPPIVLQDDEASIITYNPEYFKIRHPHNRWCVAAVRNLTLGDYYSIRLHSDSICQTPAATSDANTNVNYVLVDNHHESAVKGIKTYGSQPLTQGTIEYEDGNEVLLTNQVLPFAWPAGDIAEVYDVHLTPGLHTFRMEILPGSADLDFALYGSTTNVFHQARSHALAWSVNPTATTEVFTYYIMIEDDYALVVFANDDQPGSGTLVIESMGSWLGTVDNNWHNPSNWSMNTVPDGSTHVNIQAVQNMPWVYTGNAFCQSLTLQPFTSIRILDQSLTVSGDASFSGALNMDNPTSASQFTVMGTLRWREGSSAFANTQTQIAVYGDFVIEPGANVNFVDNEILFLGNTPSTLEIRSPACSLPHITLSKDNSHVSLSSATTDDLVVNGLFYIHPNSTFYGYSPFKTILRGNLSVQGQFMANTGTTEFQCFQHSHLLMGTGSFFRHLNINGFDTLTLQTPVEVRGNLSFTTGTLDANAQTIRIQGDWSNPLGPQAFIETGGKVSFTGGNYPQYCSSEAFDTLEVSKPLGGALRIWGSIVNCSQYKWENGAIDVNLGLFQANDLAGNGIFGDWYVNPFSFVNISNYDGPVHLNGNLMILGGQFDVYGGSGINSFWSLEGHAGLFMADGVLDFHDAGIQIPNTSYNFLSLITGGTIRSSGDFGVNRSTFAPTGGKIELYGSGLSNLHMEAGNFWDIRINKSGVTQSVDVLSNLTISNDLNLTKGTFNIAVPATVYIARDLNVDTAIIRMNSENDVMRVARHYFWNAGSSVHMYGAGTFRALGNWTYAEGSNVNMTQGNVHFLGENPSSLYCHESNSGFFNLWINKTGTTPVNIDYFSSDTVNILGDLLIFTDKYLISNTPWPVRVQGVFDNDGHYRFNNGELVLHTPYSISPGAGDYFSTLRLQGPALPPFTFDFSRNDTLRVNLDVNIQTGSLNMMNKILAFGRHWNNMAGESAFVEGSGQVIANGFSGITQNILNDETFSHFIIKPLHASDYPVVSLFSANRTLNVGQNLTIERGKLLLTQNASLVIGNDFILREQGSLYGEASNAIVSLPGNWYDYTSAITNETGFTYGNTTVTFNGTPNQNIYQYGSGLSKFYNLTVFKYGGTLSPQGNVEIRGDLTVQLGNYERIDNGHEIYLYGNLSTNPGTGFYPRGILRCVGNNNSTLALNGNGWLLNFVVNKAEPANSVSLLSNVVSMNAGELNVYNGQLILGSHYYRCTGAVNISTYGKLSIGDDGWLEVGGSSYLNVNGTLEVLGSPGHEAKVTHHSGYYDFDINSGASIAASYAIFEYMSAAGLHLWGGANIDASNSFNSCTFRYGMPAGTLLTVDNAQDITATNVNFPTNTYGCTYNVSKTSDQGSITFLESTGAFSGETFENDMYGRVNWGYPLKNLNLMVYLEGLFNTSTAQMNKAHNATGEQFDGVKADEIDIELHAQSHPYAVMHSASGLTLNMDGSVSLTVPGNLSGSYYLVLKHRNHLETWSAATVSFNGNTISYNFTDAAGKAYGNNQKEVLPNTWGLYAGDVVQDGNIDQNDMDFMAAAATTFTTGYVPRDLNGDGVVDATDLILADNNAASFIQRLTP